MTTTYAKGASCPKSRVGRGVARFVIYAIVCTGVVGFAVRGQEDSPSKPRTMGKAKLEPGAVFSFKFHDLPKTLYEMHTGKWNPAMMTVRMPDNYNTNDKFPLLVFLRGGDGSDCKAPGEQAITGGKDYIFVVMPLFQIDMTDKSAAGGLFIMPYDYVVMAPAYKAMLAKLKQEVPNLRYEGSTLGGFSNGAHTIAALIDYANFDVLNSFENFFLVDGGFSLARPQNLGGRNLLLLFGGMDEGELTVARRANGNRILQAAQAAGVKCEFKEMPGVGHAFPAEQYPVVHGWMKQVSSKPK